MGSKCKGEKLDVWLATEAGVGVGRGSRRGNGEDRKNGVTKLWKTIQDATGNLEIEKQKAKLKTNHKNTNRPVAGQQTAE